MKGRTIDAWTEEQWMHEQKNNGCMKRRTMNAWTEEKWMHEKMNNECMNRRTMDAWKDKQTMNAWKSEQQMHEKTNNECMNRRTMDTWIEEQWMHEQIKEHLYGQKVGLLAKIILCGLRLGYMMQLCCIQHERCIMIDRVAQTKTLFRATFWGCIQLSFG